MEAAEPRKRIVTAEQHKRWRANREAKYPGSRKRERAKYIENNRERFNAAARARSLAYYYANKETVLAKIREREIMKYGLTTESYSEMLAKQGGKCRICGRDRTDTRRGNLCIDHDHKSGRVRGLLCQNCNTGIGMFSDDVSKMRAAIAYLEEQQIHAAV